LLPNLETKKKLFFKIVSNLVTLTTNYFLSLQFLFHDFLVVDAYYYMGVQDQTNLDSSNASHIEIDIP